MDWTFAYLLQLAKNNSLVLVLFVWAVYSWTKLPIRKCTKCAQLKFQTKIISIWTTNRIWGNQIKTYAVITHEKNFGRPKFYSDVYRDFFSRGSVFYANLCRKLIQYVRHKSYLGAFQFYWAHFFLFSKLHLHIIIKRGDPVLNYSIIFN